MDGSDHGTPNPLNPIFGDIPETPMVQPDQLEQPAQPDQVEQPEQPARPASAMPVMKEARPAPRPANHGVIDPMMRSVPRQNNVAPKPTVTAEETFDSLVTDNDSLEMLTQDITATSGPSKAEVLQTEIIDTNLNDLGTPDLVAKDSIVESADGKGKKKKGLIIFLIIFFILAIICGAGAVAAIMLNNNQDDKVTKAIEKVLNGEMPAIIAAQGTIESSASVSDDSGAVTPTTSNLVLDFDGTFDTTSGENKVSADIAMNYGDNTDVSVSVEEMRTDAGDSYFKFSGLSSILNTFTENTTMSALASSFSGLFEAADDNWILISDEFGDSMENLELFDNSSTCLINAFSTLPNYSSDIITKYKANPFITSSTENLGITKKANALYRLTFDSDKLSAFSNSLGNNGFINELNACAGTTASNSGTTSTSIEAIFSNFPVMYVEIDNDNNFTRFYFQINVDSGNASSAVVADVSLSYPKDFKISEPADYITMSQLLNDVMTKMLTTDTTEEQIVL